MKKLLLYLAILLAGFASCKKSNKYPAPVTDPTKGSVSGIISPSGAVTGITATSVGQSSITYTAMPDAASGAFKISNMLPGPYKVHFATASTFIPYADVDAAVIDGHNYNLGNFSFQAGAAITGTISPIGSVTYVGATNTQTNLPSPVALDGGSGGFQAALPAGNYTISFSTTLGYKSPGNSTVILTTGQVMNMGTIAMRPNMFTGTPFTAQGVTLSYSAPNLTMNSGYSNIDMVSNKTFKIVMDNITSPGTYVCKETATSNITYIAKNGSLTPTITWSSINAGGSGTIVVTSIDAVKKEIKGTFTATLVSSPAGYADVVINNGSFDFGY